MTKVRLQYDLVHPLTDADAAGISNVHGYYGFLRVQPSPEMNKLNVEYDASRLTEKEVEAALHRYGIPIQRMA
jgi:hypothetical protein